MHKAKSNPLENKSNGKSRGNASDDEETQIGTENETETYFSLILKEDPIIAVILQIFLTLIIEIDYVVYEEIR